MTDMEFLKDVLNEKILIVGVGSNYRKDDGVGNYIAESLKDIVISIPAEENPELYIEMIKALKPDTVLIFDAADFDGIPGDVREIKDDEIDNFTISTHTLPLSIFSHMLKMDSNIKVKIIGIKPENISYGKGLTETVKRSADNIINYLKNILKE